MCMFVTNNKSQDAFNEDNETRGRKLVVASIVVAVVTVRPHIHTTSRLEALRLARYDDGMHKALYVLTDLKISQRNWCVCIAVQLKGSAHESNA
jgi:hypothetical protein